ncbi:hypothetical protein [Nostoc sp. 'Lobaria pulmonaria (5183) cyanobiont']|uniref:hypothetical protein n=1 Tax=Nostoc sp. 'Lobaria pulmonaria (5183) cyanobiont' TaxID=1618022 RepID=UPI000CF3553A|nr:hypothetical protein [Nostoc sp. 'Lobaria pulmonaria (5183) cyanobiont']AVH71872.1 hypothetical protein NLP_3314 [Nostoc sp. 'Lobaria pulmonaria (5183) cyanobiont']
MKPFLFSALLITSSAIAVACQPTPQPPIANQSTASEISATQIDNQEKAGFNSEIYLLANPDVVKLIQEGKFKSALDHYEKVGKSGKNSKGEVIEGYFTGTSGNDTVTGFGQSPCLTGINFEIVSDKKGPFPIRPKTLGVGEVDTLIATKGSKNEFLLGSFITIANPKAEPFYVGKGDADYARIQNFTKSQDRISLAGQPQQYKFETVKGNFRILTASGDLIAIVEGIDKLEAGKVFKKYGVFTLK